MSWKQGRPERQRAEGGDEEEDFSAMMTTDEVDWLEMRSDNTHGCWPLAVGEGVQGDCWWMM